MGFTKRTHDFVEKIYLKDYDIEENEHFVKYVFVPYFRDIFKDLAERSDKKQKGINRVVFLEVSPRFRPNSLLVHKLTRHFEWKIFPNYRWEQRWVYWSERVHESYVQSLLQSVRVQV